MGWLDRILGKETKGTAKMESSTEKSDEQAIDPVCGMTVDKKTAPAKSEYMGKTYYFCAPGCKKTFDQDPAKYAEAKGQPMSGMSGHGGHH